MTAIVSSYFGAPGFVLAVTMVKRANGVALLDRTYRPPWTAISPQARTASTPNPSLIVLSRIDIVSITLRGAIAPGGGAG